MTGTAVVTVVQGRHDHLRHQQARLARGTVTPDVVVVVSMGDPAVADVVAAGPLAGLTEVVDCPAPDRLPLARARNLGAERAFQVGAGLAVLLDVDCLPSPGLLQAYSEAHGRTEGRRVLCGPVAYLPPPAGSTGYADDELAAAAPHPARPAPPVGQLVEADDVRLFWSLSFAVDPSSWRAVGGFDEGYDGYGGEDTDFGQRLRRAGAGMWWVGGATAWHQWHPVSEPPVEHVDDIVRNANRFHRRWGWFPMEGWLAAFAVRGLAYLEPARGEWVRLDAPVGPVAVTPAVRG